MNAMLKAGLNMYAITLYAVIHASRQKYVGSDYNEIITVFRVSTCLTYMSSHFFYNSVLEVL